MVKLSAYHQEFFITAPTAEGAKLAGARIRDVMNAYKRLLQGRKARNRQLQHVKHTVPYLTNPSYFVASNGERVYAVTTGKDPTPHQYGSDAADRKK